MTFIATVIANNGTAIIADSIVTSTQPVIEYNEFVKYFERKIEETKDKSITLDPKEIIKLFETKPHHTKNYEEKLFEYDKYQGCSVKICSYLINNGIVSNVINRSVLI